TGTPDNDDALASPFTVTVTATDPDMASVSDTFTLTITNTSDQRQSLNVFAGLAGHARREMIIPGIAPGEFVSRRIRFKDVGEQIGKFPLRCGVRESNGPAVLNKTIELLPPRKAKDPPAGIAEVPAE
ncbi:MAG: hypothetical protein ACPG4Q_15775, partial [Phycisphaeraceae bacterium]